MSSFDACGTGNAAIRKMSRSVALAYGLVTDIPTDEANRRHVIKGSLPEILQGLLRWLASGVEDEKVTVLNEEESAEQLKTLGELVHAATRNAIAEASRGASARGFKEAVLENYNRNDLIGIAREFAERKLLSADKAKFDGFVEGYPRAAATVEDKNRFLDTISPLKWFETTITSAPASSGGAGVVSTIVLDISTQEQSTELLISLVIQTQNAVKEAINSAFSVGVGAGAVASTSAASFDASVRQAYSNNSVIVEVNRLANQLFPLDKDKFQRFYREYLPAVLAAYASDSRIRALSASRWGIEDAAIAAAISSAATPASADAEARVVAAAGTSEQSAENLRSLSELVHDATKAAIREASRGAAGIGFVDDVMRIYHMRIGEIPLKELSTADHIEFITFWRNYPRRAAALSGGERERFLQKTPLQWRNEFVAAAPAGAAGTGSAPATTIGASAVDATTGSGGAGAAAVGFSAVVPAASGSVPAVASAALVLFPTKAAMVAEFVQQFRLPGALPMGEDDTLNRYVVAKTLHYEVLNNHLDPWSKPAFFCTFLPVPSGEMALYIVRDDVNSAGDKTILHEARLITRLSDGSWQFDGNPKVKTFDQLQNYLRNSYEGYNLKLLPISVDGWERVRSKAISAVVLRERIERLENPSFFETYRETLKIDKPQLVDDSLFLLDAAIYGKVRYVIDSFPADREANHGYIPLKHAVLNGQFRSAAILLSGGAHLEMRGESVINLLQSRIYQDGLLVHSAIIADPRGRTLLLNLFLLKAFNLIQTKYPALIKIFQIFLGKLVCEANKNKENFILYTLPITEFFLRLEQNEIISMDDFREYQKICDEFLFAIPQVICRKAVTADKVSIFLRSLNEYISNKQAVSGTGTAIGGAGVTAAASDPTLEDLFSAVATGDLKRIESCRKAGVDFNLVDRERYTPLACAICHNKFCALICLLGCGAYFDDKIFSYVQNLIEYRYRPTALEGSINLARQDRDGWILLSHLYLLETFNLIRNNLSSELFEILKIHIRQLMRYIRYEPNKEFILYIQSIFANFLINLTNHGILSQTTFAQYDAMRKAYLVVPVDFQISEQDVRLFLNPLAVHVETQRVRFADTVLNLLKQWDAEQRQPNPWGESGIVGIYQRFSKDVCSEDHFPNEINYSIECFMRTLHENRLLNDDIKTKYFEIISYFSWMIKGWSPAENRLPIQQIDASLNRQLYPKVTEILRSRGAEVRWTIRGSFTIEPTPASVGGSVTAGPAGFFPSVVAGMGLRFPASALEGVPAGSGGVVSGTPVSGAAASGVARLR